MSEKIGLLDVVADANVPRDEVWMTQRLPALIDTTSGPHITLTYRYRVVAKITNLAPHSSAD